MFHPVQKDHELCCSNCGCVIGTIQEPIQEIQKQTVSVDLLLLGSALNNNVKHSYGRTRQQLREETTLKLLESLCDKFGLPEIFAIETFQVMKRNKRGFQSEYEYVKQLIKILSKDENYLHIHKLRMLKAWYEKTTNI